MGVPNQQPIFALTANIVATTFVNADGTTPKTIMTGAAQGTKVLGIALTSDDTATVYAQLFVRISATNYLIGTLAVPTLSGTDGTVAARDLLEPSALPFLDSDGELFLPSGVELRVGPKTAVTAAKTLTVVGFGADY